MDTSMDTSLRVPVLGTVLFTETSLGLRSCVRTVRVFATVPRMGTVMVYFDAFEKPPLPSLESHPRPASSVVTSEIRVGRNPHRSASLSLEGQTVLDWLLIYEKSAIRTLIWRLVSLGSSATSIGSTAKLTPHAPPWGCTKAPRVGIVRGPVYGF